MWISPSSRRIAALSAPVSGLIIGVAWRPSGIQTGFPRPYSEDPTQWLSNGTVMPSDAPLQVAVARLLGYRWPEQVKDAVDPLVDDDGIVCPPAVRGEPTAVDRLRQVLAGAYGKEWSPA